MWTENFYDSTSNLDCSTDLQQAVNRLIFLSPILIVISKFISLYPNFIHTSQQDNLSVAGVNLVLLGA